MDGPHRRRQRDAHGEGATGQDSAENQESRGDEPEADPLAREHDNHSADEQHRRDDDGHELQATASPNRVPGRQPSASDQHHGNGAAWEVPHELDGGDDHRGGEQGQGRGSNGTPAGHAKILTQLELVARRRDASLPPDRMMASDRAALYG